MYRLPPPEADTPLEATIRPSSAPDAPEPVLLRSRPSSTSSALRRSLWLYPRRSEAFIRLLENAGLISRGREAQTRPVKLNAKPLKEVEMWLGDFRRFWSESFDRLETYVEELKTKEKRNGRRNKARR